MEDFAAKGEFLTIFEIITCNLIKKEILLHHAVKAERWKSTDKKQPIYLARDFRDFVLMK